MNNTVFLVAKPREWVIVLTTLSSLHKNFQFLVYCCCVNVPLVPSLVKSGNVREFYVFPRPGKIMQMNKVTEKLRIFLMNTHISSYALFYNILMISNGIRFVCESLTFKYVGGILRQ